jgi:hypothetical protein
MQQDRLAMNENILEVVIKLLASFEITNFYDKLKVYEKCSVFLSYITYP